MRRPSDSIHEGDPTMTGPLSDYRVLELTSTVSGPMAGMILADQGADVIKIEPPLLGDTARFLGSSRAGMGGMYAVLNRNKRSLVLDLKGEEDMEIFLQLVATADVLLENYRPGIMRKLGIDHTSLAKINPKLIYASISGYGQEGPYKNRRVYDPLIQATTGLAHAQGVEEPRNVQSIVFDKITGMTTAQAVTTALLQREKTGQGQYLPVSMLESALYYNWPDMMWSRTLQGDGISYAGELADYFQIFKLKDGSVSIVLVADPAVELLCVWRGNTLHEDPRFKTLLDRLKNATAWKLAVEEMLADLTAEEVCETLDSFGVPVARVNTLDEVHEDPQVLHDGSLIETTHPVIGDMRLPRPPVRFIGQDLDPENFPARHAAFLGEHNREILSELKVDEAAIARMEQREENNHKLISAATAAAADTG
ncbi:MAG TPA: CoA transferase [Myxococcales bacterium]|nr:CoA transferase [Myxococcales bacterium]